MELFDLNKLKKLSIEEQIKIKKATINTYELDAIPIAYLPDVVAEEYFFISYSHLDYREVYNDIFDLQQAGLSIWYDRGIPAGSSWKEVATKYIAPFSCKGTLFYISENALVSDAVKMEITSALSYNKPFLVILISSKEESLKDLIERLHQEKKIDGDKYHFYLDVFKEEIIYLPIKMPNTTKVEKILNSIPKQEILSWGRLEVLNTNKDGYPKAYSLWINGTNDFYATRIEIKHYLSLINEKNLREFKDKELDEYEYRKYNHDCIINDWNDIEALTVYIGVSAFANLPTLEYFEFPAINYPGRPAIISSHAFYCCERLKEFKFIRRDDEERDIYFREGAFSVCHSLEHFDFTHVGFDEDCFSSCSSLKEADLSHSLCKEDYIFENNKSIKIKAIPKTAFSHCTSLKKVIFPEDLYQIEIDAFSDSGLESVEFPASLKVIEEGAFEYCPSLKTIKLNKGLTRIGYEAFAYCPKLEEVYYPGSKEELDEIIEGDAFADDSPRRYKIKFIFGE